MRYIVDNSDLHLSLITDYEDPQSLAQTINHLKYENHQLQKSISQITKERDRALKLARIDPLTELLNRRGGEERVQLFLAQAARNEISLVYARLDIDQFKLLNDHQGHAWGDTILKSIAKIIKETCRDTDAVFRYGGEEFDLCLPMEPNTTMDDINQMINRYLDGIHHLYRHKHKPHHIPKNTEPLTASFGVAIIQQGETFSLKEIQSIADKYLYQSKHNGRNRITTDYAYSNS